MSEINHEIGVQTNFAKLLKTGQTTQYGGYEDDGYFEKGISKQYTILTSGQYAGTTDITLNAKTDSHSNNCVYDKRTKLMWSRYVSGSLGPASDGKLPWTTNGNGEGVFAYVAAANLANLGGHSDWRIPNIFELISIFIFKDPMVLPDSTSFPVFPSTDWIYSSTTNPGSTTQALAFRGGISGSQLVGAAKTTNYWALLVRGG